MKQKVIQSYYELSKQPVGFIGWLHVKFLGDSNDKLIVTTKDVKYFTLNSVHSRPLVVDNFYLRRIFKTRWENGRPKYVVFQKRHYDLTNKKIMVLP